MAAAMLAPTPPTSMPSTFEEFLSNATNDHYDGLYPALMLPFTIDGANAAASPSTVRAQVVEATAQRKAVCLVALIDDMLQPFFLPFTIKPALGGVDDPSIHNKMHAFHGEVILGMATLVHVPDDYFNQATPVQVPTVTHAKALIAGDATITSFGPFVHGEPDTTLSRTRKVCAIPAKYAGFFLQSDEGVTPLQFVNELLPIIEADGNDGALAPLILFVIASMTKTTGVAGQGPGPSAVLVTAPQPVARNTSLLTHSQSLLKSHLTGLGNVGSGALNLGPLISAINDGHSQATIRANEERQERKAKEAKNVESMLGKEHLAHLLRLCGATSEADLPPLWLNMANAPKSSRLVVLQNMIQQEYINQNLLHEHHLPNLSFLLNFVSMSWVPFADSLEGGSLANPFHFGATNQEAFHQLNSQLQLIMDGGATPSLIDAQTLLKTKTCLPGPEESIDIIRRWKVFLTVALPVGHPLTVYLADHIEVMKSFEPIWKNYLTHEPLKYRLKSVLHLKFFMLRFQRFITAINQGRHIPTLDPNEISDAVMSGIRWEPLLTPAFSARYNLDYFAQLHPPGGPLPTVPPPASRIPQHPAPAGGGGAIIPTPAGSGGPPPISPVINPSPIDNRAVNTSFNVSLFGSYKTSGIKARALRDKIEQGTLVALPKSKVDIAQPMCLAWHTKGQCNARCPCAYDHVQYSATEYAPLATWCVIGYAPPAPAT